MSQQDIKLKQKIRSGEPIACCGLMFYPIKMSDYEMFVECKDAIALRMSTLPVKYLVKDYLSAIYSMDADSLEQTGKKSGLFSRLICFFCLSLRIGVENIQSKIEIEEMKVGEERLVKNLIVIQSGQRIPISSVDFSFKIRPLLAQLNGITLPDESENVDLVRDAEELSAINQKIKLNCDYEDLISSVAYLSHVREKEINNWTVREFESRRRAIERDKRYMLYGSAEMSGMVSFKNGNPAPSWCYDALEDNNRSSGLEKLNQAFQHTK